MSAVYKTHTRRGLRAWIQRKWEQANVAATLRAAERDRAEFAAQLAALPFALHQLDLDIGALRVRQAHLRNT